MGRLIGTALDTLATRCLELEGPDRRSGVVGGGTRARRPPLR